MNAILGQEGMGILDKNEARKGHICDRKKRKVEYQNSKGWIVFFTEGTSLLGVMEQKKKVIKQYAINRGPKKNMMKT
jgi:hypothetical protein